MVSIHPVHFRTRNDDNGSLLIQEAGQIFKFKRHTSCSVTCDTSFISTDWGCLNPEYGYDN